ncbi:hypothetical protein B0O99DRAFT_592200 [Bisporella sp. PMI_857]|nr:hypothetical protein B0O99DRAFT_592200 [Bisporella sp. PMI_857]
MSFPSTLSRFLRLCQSSARLRMRQFKNELFLMQEFWIWWLREHYLSFRECTGAAITRELAVKAANQLISYLTQASNAHAKLVEDLPAQYGVKAIRLRSVTPYLSSWGYHGRGFYQDLQHDNFRPNLPDQSIGTVLADRSLRPNQENFQSCKQSRSRISEFVPRSQMNTRSHGISMAMRAAECSRN